MHYRSKVLLLSFRIGEGVRCAHAADGAVRCCVLAECFFLPFLARTLVEYITRLIDNMFVVEFYFWVPPYALAWPRRCVGMFLAPASSVSW